MTIQYDNLNSTISAVGSATNIPVNIQTKGTGGLNLLGSGTNLLLRSQAWATSPWFNAGLTSIANNTTDVTDPLGGNTATKIVATGSGSAVLQAVTLVASPQTASVYLRTLSGTATCDLIVYLGSAPFTNIGTTSVTITSSWQRFSVVTSTATAASYNFQLNNISASTIYGWGAQVEIGSTLRDYVATTTTAIYGTPTLTLSGVAGVGLQSDGSLYVQPAGTGAIQAQATTSTTTGGNARGANAVDWQTSRSTAAQVASATASVIGGGVNHTTSGTYSFVGGGFQNTSSANGAGVVTGSTNTASGIFAIVGAGVLNTATGYYGFVGNGYRNSTTSNSAVTTQATTTVTSGSTAVTLSGTNANIKVGQLITGTGIANDTYVAAISGTSLTLSQNANATGTPTLSFFTPHGVVVGGGNNQATGSYSFIGGGGDAGNTTNRNTASGDWSFVGGGARNTASGNASVVCGGGFFNTGFAANTASGIASFIGSGVGNAASGQFASVIAGSNNTANSGRSFVTGEYGSSRSITGYHVFAACAGPIANVQGATQSGLLLLARETTDATPTVLTCNTSAAGTTNQVILPNNSAYLFKATVISAVTGGGNTSGWKLEGVIKRGANAASTAIVGTVTTTLLAQDAGASTWAVAVTADTTNGGIKVEVTGQASTTIRWVCQIRTTEMTY
jgi:hypothetical protein